MFFYYFRGHEEASLILPRRTSLSIIGVGGSVSTREEGITADVLVVKDFDELEARSSEVRF